MGKIFGDDWEYHAILWEAELDAAPPLVEDKAWWFINSTLWEEKWGE